MNTKLLFAFLATVSLSFAQDDYQSKIKLELVEWDDVRGEWLSESFNAMATNQPIPDRTFPEELTPAEMYSLVPSDRRERIRDIVSQSNQSTNPRERVPSQSSSSTDETRVPVGSNPNNQRDPSFNTQDRYTYYLSRPGCELTSGRTYGDPHIRTFDGNSYSFQTVGEYVLSSSPDRSFEVQTRQKPQTDKVSLNTAVAMNVYGDRVGVYASDIPDGVSGTPIRVNGRPVFLNNETYYLPRGGTIQNTGKEYVITWPTGEKVQAKLASTGGMRFVNVSVYVYKCNGNYYGLMGNANGRSDDDFNGSNSRTNFSSSSIFTPFDSRDFGRSSSEMEREQLAFLARDFGNQFLVNDQTSLFDYEFGKSSWTFHDPSFPRNYITLGDLAQSDRDRARRECERQGVLRDDMSGCVMDLAHANIQPSARPTPPNRTSGRETTPVTDRKPNVNRPDVYERVASNNTERTPSTTDRTPSSKEDVKLNKEESFENTRGESTGATTSPAPVKTTDTSFERKPIETVSPAEKETVKETERTPVARPTTSENNSGVVRKPVETPAATNKPAERPHSPASQPVSKPATTPARVNDSKPSDRTPSNAGTVLRPQSTVSQPAAPPTQRETVSKPVEKTKVETSVGTKVTSPSSTPAPTSKRR